MDQPEVLRLAFLPQKLWRVAPPGSTDHMVPLADGVTLSARFYVRDKRSPTILLFHGNGEVSCQYDDLAMHYRNTGANLFVADYRGYGLSGGTPSFGTLMDDARATYEHVSEFLDSEGYTGAHFVKGRSIGSQPALEVAAVFQRHLAGLIIESGFAGTEQLFERFKADPQPPAVHRMGARHREKLATIRLPLLVIHGEDDQLVPSELAMDLYGAINSADKDLLLVPGAGHNDLLTAAPLAYFGAIKDFVAKHLHRDVPPPLADEDAFS